MIRREKDDGTNCLTANIVNKSISLSECNTKDESQKWQFGYVNQTAINNWNTIDGYKQFLKLT